MVCGVPVLMKKILITTGDTDGIGQEVTFKALNKLGPKKKFQLIVFINKGSRQLSKYKLNSFNKIYFDSLSLYLKSNRIFSYQDLIIIKSSESPTAWVVDATKAGINKEISALVTGPLSKTESFKTHKLKGHTNLFRRFVKTPIFMSFIGKHFNVLLLTDHIPLNQVSSAITNKLVIDAFKQSLAIAQLKPNLKVAVIGVNPHAGENKLLGNEESKILTPVIKQYNKSSKIKFTLPIVPDVAFLKTNWKKYSLFISPYHDQGLTAFKMIHEHSSGIQLTLGLPFTRTSVDHGTAKDLYGKNIADERSMLMAIKYALKLT